MTAPRKSPQPADIRNWPQTLQEIARLIGAAAAQKLAEDRGGVETYIPKYPGPNHELAKIIGLPALTILAKAYGGLTVEVPRGTFMNLKKAAIMQSQGSRREVALKLGCSARYVRKVANALKDPRQGDLLGDD